MRFDTSLNYLEVDFMKDQVRRFVPAEEVPLED